jgi:hypothetical protein
VNDTKENFHEAIELALDLIKETPTGAYLVDAAQKQNANIFFDEELAHANVGVTSFDMTGAGNAPEIRLNKKLIPTDKPSSLAMEPAGSDEKLGKLICILTHELVHLSIGKQNDFSVVFKNHKPSDVLSLMKADEANAHAQTAQVAWELNEVSGIDLALNELTGKADYTFGDEKFKSKMDNATMAFVEMAKKNPASAKNGTACKAAFEARFHDVANNSVYDEMYISTYESVLADKSFFETLKTVPQKDKVSWLKEKSADIFCESKPVSKSLVNALGKTKNSKNYLADEKGSCEYILSKDFNKKGLCPQDVIRLNKIEKQIEKVQKSVKPQISKMILMQKNEYRISC